MKDKTCLQYLKAYKFRSNKDHVEKQIKSNAQYKEHFHFHYIIFYVFAIQGVNTGREIKFEY